MNNRLFAIGDIHGCYEPLRELIENEINIQKNDQLVFLGDYIDRGKHAKDVIDYIIRLIHDGYQIIPIMGNHEEMLLNAYEDQSNLHIWMYNGGDTTLESFGIRSVKNLSVEYLDFFKKLNYYFKVQQNAFVHAGFNNNTLDPFTDRHSMVWECRKTYTHPMLQNTTIVHGHCAITAKECDKIIRSGSKVIDIDTGCVYNKYPGYGNLTAVELHSRKIFRVRYE